MKNSYVNLSGVRYTSSDPIAMNPDFVKVLPLKGGKCLIPIQGVFEMVLTIILTVKFRLIFLEKKSTKPI